MKITHCELKGDGSEIELSFLGKSTFIIDTESLYKFLSEQFSTKITKKDKEHYQYYKNCAKCGDKISMTSDKPNDPNEKEYCYECYEDNEHEIIMDDG